jgi:uncharacterized protein YbaP (TraB family)
MTKTVSRIRRSARSLFRSARLSLSAGLLTFVAPVAALAMTAHPALWTVHSKAATAYLLGSIHALPANVEWHTPEIDQAMQAADTFYFETSLDSAWEVLSYERYHGNLPDRTTLRSLLDPQTLAEYQHALALAHLSADELDDERPWRAARSIGHAYSERMGYKLELGVDLAVWSFAREHHRTLQAFETTQQQLDLIVPKDQKLELAEFAAFLKDLEGAYKRYQAVLAAWSAGDAQAIANLDDQNFDVDPEAKKAIIDERNRRWVKWFDLMLSRPGTYFVTVGVGHLVGPTGVPALLRAKGYKVDGP